MIKPYWRISPEWNGELVVIAATGPSVSRSQIEKALEAKAKLVVINDNYLLSPEADIHYFCDSRWRDWHKDRPEYKSFRGRRVTLENRDIDEDLFCLRNDERKGFCDDPSAIRTGGNSGYQSLHMVGHLAPGGTVILIGYDMKPSSNGKHHWFGDHPNQCGYGAYKDTMLPLFPSIEEGLKKRGIKVINSTPDSELKIFPMVSLDEALSQHRLDRKVKEHATLPQHNPGSV